MQKNFKIILLVALALLLTLTACNRQASKAPVTVPTATGEAPFPFTTPGDMTQFGTQTAIASTPGAGAAATPQVIIATETPQAEAQPAQEQPAAQPEAAQVINTPVIERPGTYSLQKGEWPICIARRYNLDIPSFFAANGLNMNSKPAAGTTLKIPSSGSWNASYGARALRQHPTTYTVASGDTVYTIACYFGDVDPASILAVNGFANASDVKTGQTIKIP
jgi:LysM repeat protein